MTLVDLGDEPVQALRLDLIEAALDLLPQTPFNIKDSSFRYAGGNSAMLEMCAVKSRAEFVGRTARDFLTPPMWKRYDEVDRRVMREQRPIRDQVELCSRLGGPPVWLYYGKWPIVGCTLSTNAW